MSSRTFAVVGVGLSLMLSSCADDDGSAVARDDDQPDRPEALSVRLDELGAAVADWRDASTIEAAKVAAETAANLVVGPNGPNFGDRDGDGTISGETGDGLLPGLGGEGPGLALASAGNECVERDVLGGPWDDPAERWDIMLTAIDEWRPDDNTMPSLPSHPMRVVGWATLTLETDDLDEAHEYAGHAQLHVDVSQRALGC